MLICYMYVLISGIKQYCSDMKIDQDHVVRQCIRERPLTTLTLKKKSGKWLKCWVIYLHKIISLMIAVQGMNVFTKCRYSKMHASCGHCDLCRIDPIHFLAGLHRRWLKLGLVRLVWVLLGFVCVYCTGWPKKPHIFWDTVFLQRLKI